MKCYTVLQVWISYLYKFIIVTGYAVIALGDSCLTTTDGWADAQRRSLAGGSLKYDYRYSQLVFVLGILLREKRITEDELAGLAKEKLMMIRAFLEP
jgi:hypothetical protein